MEYALPRDVQATLRGYLAAGERRRQVEAEYARTQRATARTLADSLDLPVRDVARLIGMSRSHAATLLRPTSA